MTKTRDINAIQYSLGITVLAMLKILLYVHFMYSFTNNNNNNAIYRMSPLSQH